PTYVICSYGCAHETNVEGPRPQRRVAHLEGDLGAGNRVPVNAKIPSMWGMIFLAIIALVASPAFAGNVSGNSGASSNNSSGSSESSGASSGNSAESSQNSSDSSRSSSNSEQSSQQTSNDSSQQSSDSQGGQISTVAA